MRYAAYGSNLHPTRLGERVRSAQLLGTGLLQDWSLRFHKLSKDASGKCSIVPGSEGVHFAIYDISDADKLLLDRIAALPSIPDPDSQRSTRQWALVERIRGGT